MGLKTTSSSNFLNSVQGNSKPRSGADSDPQPGGPAMEDMAARRSALRQTPQPSPFINAVPKFSTGPRSRQASFPTKSESERQAP